MRYHWEQFIVQKGHSALSSTAAPVDVDDITSPELQSMITDMHRLLAQEYDGVALAAPQIGSSLRMFVVSPRAFRKMHSLEPLVYINPVITKRSKQTKKMEEGCLSVRGWYGKTLRNTSVTVSAFNERGQRFTREATGLLAHIFQHEIDHLDGVLFDDHAVDIEQIDTNKN